MYNTIFTFYYTRVRPQCDFSILGRTQNGGWHPHQEIAVTGIRQTLTDHNWPFCHVASGADLKRWLWALYFPYFFSLDCLCVFFSPLHGVWGFQAAFDFFSASLFWFFFLHVFTILCFFCGFAHYCHFKIVSRSSFWTAGICCTLWSFKYASLRASMTSSVTAHIFSDDLSNIAWGAQWLCADSDLREDNHLLDNFVTVRARKCRIMVSQLISSHFATVQRTELYFCQPKTNPSVGNPRKKHKQPANKPVGAVIHDSNCKYSTLIQFIVIFSRTHTALDARSETRHEHS